MEETTEVSLADDKGAEEVVVAAVAATPGPKKLTTEERLSIENVYLKMQNTQLQVQNMDNLKAQKVEEMRALQEEMTRLTNELSQKYGVPIGRTTVQADGTIVPSRVAMPMVPRTPGNGAH